LVLLINDIEILLEIAAIGPISTSNIDLLGRACSWRSTADDSDFLRLRVELCSPNFYLAFGSRVGPGIVIEVDSSRLKAQNVSLKGADMNLRVRFGHFDLVLKVNWAVTLNLKLLGVGLADRAGTAHVDVFGEKLVLG